MAERTCSVEGCEKRHYARDLCNMHYQRLIKRGSLDPPLRNADGVLAAEGERVCAEPECLNRGNKRGLCRFHYDQWNNAGVLERLVLPTLTERLWSSRDVTPAGCWEWTGTKDRNRYGHISVNGMPRLTHRIMYELIVGPIPDALPLDHLCRNPPCMNPAHLEPVTPAENARRGTWATRSHCPRGHAYVGDNLYTRSNGSRVCNECRRILVRQRRERRSA